VGKLLQPTIDMDATIEHAYDETAPYSVGAEEEFVLVDPDGGEVASRAAEVIASADPAAGIAHEVVASVVETATPVCHSMTDVAEALQASRCAVVRAARTSGCRAVSTGAHPLYADAQQLAPGERYLALEREYPWILHEAATYGLHVHVGVPGADRAIAICDAMRPFLPHLLAISANSPFWRGRATGLRSTRVLLAQLYPRSGVPPRFIDYDGYCRTIRALEVSRGVEDYTHAWWFVRPHPRFGTIEVRVCDAQTDVRRSIALVAMIRALVAWLDAELDASDARRPDPGFVIEENLWAASRDGVDAVFIDPVEGEPVAAGRAIRALLHRLTPYLVAFDATEQQQVLQRMIDRDGAREQLLELEQRGGDMPSLISHLAEVTAACCPG
jgi:carboxylate-amine ligase